MIKITSTQAKVYNEFRKAQDELNDWANYREDGEPSKDEIEDFMFERGFDRYYLDGNVRYSHRGTGLNVWNDSDSDIIISGEL